MAFTLHVDAERWRAHLTEVLEQTPGLVPVAKGNGYGFGVSLLGAETARLGLPALAVGTRFEVSAAREAYDGDVLVLTPWDHRVDPPPEADDPTIRTVSSIEALTALAALGMPTRVVVEVETSMHRHGVPHDHLLEVGPLLTGLRVEGFAIHLPLAEPRLGRLAETESLIARLWGAALHVDRLWVSHLSPHELERVRAEHPAIEVRPRVGTSLWLGEREALRATGTVLDVHDLKRGARYGYRQRKMPGAHRLLVVSGGTAHGVGLEAPKAVHGVIGRGKAAAKGGLEATGRTLSPFHAGGKQRWFAEPPHMQVSLLLVPDDLEVAIGDELDCDVRYTTTTFDEVTLEAAPRTAEETSTAS
ncbi:MAG TPA: alanine racemase [Actinomycetes bacterium]|nr:alanine racemase [Actinomycetes bacterium]